MKSFCLIAWWLSLYWTFDHSFLHPFDDWKNLLFYAGAGVFCIYQLWRRGGALPARQWCSGGSPPCLGGRRGSPLLIIFLLLYLCAAVVSLFGDAAPWYDGLLAVARIVLWAGLAWGFSRLERKELRAIAQVAVVSAAAMAVISWLELRGLLKTWPYSYPFLFPIGHVSYYGDFMALHIPFALYLVFKKRIGCYFPKKLPVPFFLICTLAIFLGLWISETRASIVGLLAAFMLLSFLLVCFRRFKFRQVAVVLALFAALAGLLSVLEVSGFKHTNPVQRLRQFSFRSEMETSPGGRWNLFKITSELALERPLTGWGIGNFRFIYPEAAHRYGVNPSVNAATWLLHPHNEPIYQWMETGIIGMFAFMGLWFSLLCGALKYLKRDSSNGLAWASFAGLVISLVSWQFSTTSISPISRLLTAFCAGVLLKEISPFIESYVVLRRVWLNRMIMAAILICTVFVSSFNLSIYFVERAWRSNVPQERLHFAEIARYLAPYAFEPLYTYVAAYQQMGFTKDLYLVERLHSQYPYVPVVLFQTAIARMNAGQIEEAKTLLTHALANDPNYKPAQRFLDSLAQ